MGGCQSRVKHRAKLLARLEQQELQRGPCRQLPHPVWGAFRFQRMDLLGRGAGGITYLCKCLDTEDVVAIKMIKRPIPMMMGHLMLREIMIQAELGAGHINIVGVKEVILTDTHLGIVMDCATGGNLARYLMKKMQQQGPVTGLLLDEIEASYLFRQLVSAVEFCHDNCIAHRDIKLDNTLLDHSHNNPPTLKLCDFGLSRCWGQEGPEMHSLAGTPTYMSPEVLRQTRENRQAGYDATKSDVWSLGVVLFVMLVGRFPFDGEGMKATSHKESLQLVLAQQQSIKSWRELPFIAPHASHMSDSLLDLLDKMFDMDATRRISVSDILRHPWCTQPLPSRMQHAWDRMQRLQLAQRLHFFPTQPRCGSFSSRNRQSAPTPITSLPRSDSSTCLIAAADPSKLQSNCCHTSLPPGTCTSPRLRTAPAARDTCPTPDSTAHKTWQSQGVPCLKLERSAHRSARGSMDQAWLKAREYDADNDAVCDPRAHSTLTHAKSVGVGGLKQKPRSNSTIPSLTPRCRCYAAHDLTPEQCAEELQQVLTLASMPTSIVDPDAVLARSQLVKVLYHVPLHKIPTISYFKEACTVRRQGTTPRGLPATKPIPAQLSTTSCSNSSRIAASSHPCTPAAPSPTSCRTPVLYHHPQHSWDNSDQHSLRTSGSSVNLPAHPDAGQDTHGPKSTTSSLTHCTPVQSDHGDSHARHDTALDADVIDTVTAHTEVVVGATDAGRCQGKCVDEEEEDDTHIAHDQLTVKGSSSSLTGLKTNDSLRITEHALPLSCPMTSALTSMLEQPAPHTAAVSPSEGEITGRSDEVSCRQKHDAAVHDAAVGMLLEASELQEVLACVSIRSCAVSNFHCCYSALDVAPSAPTVGCTASC